MTTSVPSTPLFDHSFIADPYPALAALRKDAPVHPIEAPNGMRVWLVVRYDEARRLLNDPRLSKDMRIGQRYMAENFADLVKRAAFLQENGTRRQFPVELRDHMLSSDPPDHTRLRRLIGQAFTARGVDALRPRVEHLIDELLDGFAGPGTDLLESLAYPLTVTVICWLLGVPPEDRTAFRAWSNLMVSGQEGEEVLNASESMINYLRGLVVAKRTEAGDDLLSDLVKVADAGDRLTPGELLATAFLLLVAGHETTVNLLGNGALALLTHPGQRALLAAETHRWPAAIDEMLRFDAPLANATWRFTTEAVTVGDVTIPPGEFVTIGIGAAGRDPGRYQLPEQFDITRRNAGELSFGHGIHHCLGAPLARMEAETALRRLFGRFPTMRLAVPASDLRWRPSFLIRGLQELPVTLF